MVIVGLTGGIGSGKTAVAQWLVEFGATLVDADEIARELLAPNGAMVPTIAAAFGEAILDEPGVINRQRLADLVFADPTARNQLDSLMHPAIGRICREQIAAAPDDAVVVVEIPLLVETNQQTNYQFIIVVAAPRELRLTRLERRGVKRSDALARMEAQATDAERAAVATWIIRNDGNLVDLKTATSQVWSELQQEAQKQEHS